MEFPLSHRGVTPSSGTNPIEVTTAQVDALNGARTGELLDADCAFARDEDGTLVLVVPSEEALTATVRRALGALFSSRLHLTGSFEYRGKYTAQYLCRWPYPEA